MLPSVEKSRASVIVKNGAGSEFSRRRINLVEGSNITLTITDDPTNNEIDVIITSTGTAGGSAETAHPFLLMGA